MRALGSVLVGLAVGCGGQVAPQPMPPLPVASAVPSAPSAQRGASAPVVLDGARESDAGAAPAPPRAPPPSASAGEAKSALTAFLIAAKKRDRAAMAARWSSGPSASWNALRDTFATDPADSFELGEVEEVERSSCVPATLRYAARVVTRTFCLQSEDGAWKVVSFAADHVGPVGHVPLRPAGASEPCGPFEGRLVTRAGDRVLLTIERATPRNGTLVELLRRMDDSVPLVGGTWISIAVLRIDQTEGTRVRATVMEETSPVVVNGAKLNPFTPGVEVRLDCNRRPR